jgi:hypothetical protein
MLCYSPLESMLACAYALARLEEPVNTVVASVLARVHDCSFTILAVYVCPSQLAVSSGAHL